MKKVSEQKFTAAKETYVQESNMLAKLEAERQEEISEINLRYEEEMLGHAKLAEDTKEIIERYVKENREELFDGKSKTKKYGDLEISFRSTSPKLVIAGDMTMEQILAKIKKDFQDNAHFYIKTKETLDNSGLKKMDEKKFAKLGLEFQTTEKILLKVV